VTTPFTCRSCGKPVPADAFELVFASNGYAYHNTCPHPREQEEEERLQYCTSCDTLLDNHDPEGTLCLSCYNTAADQRITNQLVGIDPTPLSIDSVLRDPSTSDWLFLATSLIRDRDPVDYLHDAETLVHLLRLNLPK
jgi:hypothetical protein